MILGLCFNSKITVTASKNKQILIRDAIGHRLQGIDADYILRQ